MKSREALLKEIIELERTVMDFKRDAIRYRYLRDKALSEYCNGPRLYWYLPRYYESLTDAESLDKAIDDCLAAP